MNNWSAHFSKQEKGDIKHRCELSFSPYFLILLTYLLTQKWLEHDLMAVVGQKQLGGQIPYWRLYMWNTHARHITVQLSALRSMKWKPGDFLVLYTVYSLPELWWKSSRGFCIRKPRMSSIFVSWRYSEIWN